jgi:hypothetical protein
MKCIIFLFILGLSGCCFSTITQNDFAVADYKCDSIGSYIWDIGLELPYEKVFSCRDDPLKYYTVKQSLKEIKSGEI